MVNKDNEIETEIRKYLAENVLFSPDGFPHADETSFLAEGIIDSMGVMELVEFVSSRFGISVNPEEITPDNFDSVAKLAVFVRGKKSAG